MNDQSNLPMRQEFGASQELAVVETASSAVAAQAKAMVESRYIMAMRNPRNWDQVRQDIMRECRRPSFANNKSAYYRKPIGAGVEGLGIRFVEVALRCMKNVLIETSMIFEDASKEVHRVCVTDLESNITYPLDVRVSKTVERSKPADDGSYISVRMNSYNKPVYTIPGTDDDLLNKRGALISKAIRTLGTRIIPGDIQDEAEEIIKSVRMDDAAKDPDKNRKILADLFAEIGVKAAALSQYLGHDLSTCSPKEIVDLRAIHGAISSGEATWAEVIDNKAQQGEGRRQEEKKTTYPDDQFAKAFPSWEKAIKNGKSPDEVIKTAESKFPLTDEQKAKVRGVKKAEASDAAGVTFAQVAEKMNKATDIDLLDAAYELVGEVSDPAQRDELSMLYGVRKDELSQ